MKPANLRKPEKKKKQHIALKQDIFGLYFKDKQYVPQKQVGTPKALAGGKEDSEGGIWQGRDEKGQHEAEEEEPRHHCGNLPLGRQACLCSVCVARFVKFI